MKYANWFGLTVAAIFLWGFYGVAFKLASDRLPALAGQVLSSAGLLLPALFLFGAVLRERRATAGIVAGFVSGLCGSVGNLALLVSLREGGKASLVFPLTALYPLVTVVAAILFLRERARRVQAIGIALAVIAVLLLSLDPSTPVANLRASFEFSRWLLYAAGALVAFGLAAVFQKMATNRISAESAFAMFAAGFVPPLAVIWLFEPWPRGVPTPAVAWAIAGGLLNGLGVLATLAAYRRGGKASVVTPLATLYPIVTVIVAIIFLGEKVNAVQLAGIGMAIAGGVLLSRE